MHSINKVKKRNENKIKLQLGNRKGNWIYKATVWSTFHGSNPLWKFVNKILKFWISFGFWRKQTSIFVFSFLLLQIYVFIILISVHNGAPLSYFNFLKQFRDKSLNKRTYWFLWLFCYKILNYLKEIFVICCTTVVDHY